MPEQSMENRLTTAETTYKFIQEKLEDFRGDSRMRMDKLESKLDGSMDKLESKLDGSTESIMRKLEEMSSRSDSKFKQLEYTDGLIQNEQISQRRDIDQIRKGVSNLQNLENRQDIQESKIDGLETTIHSLASIKEVNEIKNNISSMSQLTNEISVIRKYWKPIAIGAFVIFAAEIAALILLFFNLREVL